MSLQYFVVLFALMILVLAGAIVAMTQVRTPGRTGRKSDRNNQNIKRELINSANLSKTLCLNTSEEDNHPWRGLGMIFRSR